ncbi:MAG TPA: DoxX family protein [Fimbriimonadaceae bacterium]|nr:DoxX family protein [Fimbriimonadaceae bacterium]
MKKAEEVALFLLRIVTGFIFLIEGSMKLFGWFGGMPGGMHVSLMSQLGAAGVLEFFGGILIMLGLFTRPVAFILAGEMAVAYFQAHQPHGALPPQNGGMPAVFACFIYLFFAARGGGEWSLDVLFWGKKRDSGQ